MRFRNRDSWGIEELQIDHQRHSYIVFWGCMRLDSLCSYIVIFCCDNKRLHRLILILKPMHFVANGTGSRTRRSSYSFEISYIWTELGEIEWLGSWAEAHHQISYGISTWRGIARAMELYEGFMLTNPSSRISTRDTWQTRRQKRSA